MTTTIRPDLPPLPAFIARLPVHRGFPVPWFVAWIDGEPDFRIVAPGKVELAVQERRCWVCGERLDKRFAFVVGPMCAVNRISGEPPSHIECARFSAVACPFLSRPHMVRREGGALPEVRRGGAGIPLLRNPGVALVWTTDRYQPFKAPGGILFQIGRPIRWAAYAEGREATPEELRASVETGLPHLRELAELDGPDAVEELAAQTREACRLFKLQPLEVT